MGDPVASAFDALKHAVCILSSSLEIIQSNRAWQNLFRGSGSWVDQVNYLSRSNLLESLSQFSSSTDLQEHTLKIVVNNKEYSVHLTRDANGNILVELVDVTELVLLSSKAHDETVDEQIYNAMLSYLVRKPQQDMQLVGRLTSLRDMLRDIQRLLNTTLGIDVTGSPTVERETLRHIDILKSLSKCDLESINVSLKSVVAKPLMDRHLVLRRSRVIMEKVVDSALNESTYLICDADMVGFCIDTTLFLVQNMIDPTVSRMTVNMYYDTRTNHLVMQSVYTGRPLQQLHIRFIESKFEKKELRDLMQNISSPDMEMATAIVLLKGYMEVLNGTVQFEPWKGGRDTWSFGLSIPMSKTTIANLSGRPIRSLFADDNPTVLKINKRMAMDLGHVAIEAKDGVEAFKQFKESNPDIVFLDLELPLVNGVDVIKQIRQWEAINQGKRIPIIVVTGKRSFFPENNVLAVGADAYVDKPLRKDTYIAFISNYI